jgi:Sec-independent protein translocase protein TatA
VFGPQRLPEIARTVGRTLNELKKQASEVRAEFESGLTMDEPEDEQPISHPAEPAAEPPAPDEMKPDTAGS